MFDWFSNFFTDFSSFPILFGVSLPSKKLSGSPAVGATVALLIARGHLKAAGGADGCL